MPVNPIPAEHSSVIPYLLAADVARLIDFLKEAFDAREMHRSARPDGSVMHAHLRIGDSSIMMGHASEGHPVTPVMLYKYVADCDAVFDRAVKAGATAFQAPADQFYGDRVGGVKDPAGNQWWIATHVEDMSDEELARRAAAACK